MKKKALVTGIAGQDGSYLAELLLQKGYRVTGIEVARETPRRENIQHVIDRIDLVPGDLCDQASIDSVIGNLLPDEIYNLAAQSSSVESLRHPVRTAEINGLGPMRILEAIKRKSPQSRFFQASSAEMFGVTAEYPQGLDTPFNPGTPYGVAKLLAHRMLAHYRAQHGIYAVSGILFNHESPRRGADFVTRKISSGVAAIKRERQHELRLGDLEATRDWGFAGDFVRAMWLSLQQPDPTDYIIATGVPHMVRDFVEEAFAFAGLDWRKHVALDKKFVRQDRGYRPCGDASGTTNALGWIPETGFRDLVRMMVESELKTS